jgi:hypothetical protein
MRRNPIGRAWLCQGHRRTRLWAAWSRNVLLWPGEDDCGNSSLPQRSNLTQVIARDAGVVLVPLRVGVVGPGKARGNLVSVWSHVAMFFIHVSGAVTCYETPIFDCADGPVGKEMSPFGDDVSTERSTGNGRDERANNALDRTGIGGVLLRTLAASAQSEWVTLRRGK